MPSSASFVLCPTPVVTFRKRQLADEASALLHELALLKR